jgi:GNAT superfamily N-acetyltransferase
MTLTISNSSDNDLQAILHWLKQESDEQKRAFEHEYDFYCNRRMIEDAHIEKELIVLREDEEVVAFQLGMLLSTGILEVRPDKRGKGYGRKLVEYCVSKARSNDTCVLHITCKAMSSIPFWEKMGFTLLPNSNDAYRVLDKAFCLPNGLAETKVTIEVYPECCMWEKNVAPSTVYTPHAVLSSDNSEALLAERIIFFHSNSKLDRKSVVLIKVDNKILHFARIDFPGAEELGVCRDSGGVFYVDRIATSISNPNLAAAQK